MKKFSFTTFTICIGFCLFSTVGLYAQNTSPTPPTDEDVVKITTKLVQFDAVVTDKSRRKLRIFRISIPNRPRSLRR
jgi:hypothetical protein